MSITPRRKSRSSKEFYPHTENKELTTMLMTTSSSHKVLADAEDSPGATALANTLAVPRSIVTTPLKVIGVGAASAVAWSYDGQWFCFTSEDHAIFMCRRDQQQGFTIAGVLMGHTSHVKDLEFHPKDPSLLLSAANDGIRFWDVEKMTAIKLISSRTQPEFHENVVECMQFIYGGRVLLTGSRDANIKIWNSENPQNINVWDTLFAHKAAVLCIAWCPHTRSIATAGRDSVIKIFDASGLDVSFDGRSRDDSSMKVNLTVNLEGHRGDVSCLVWGQKGDVIFSGGKDNAIIIWDVQSSTSVRKIVGHHGDIRKLYILNQQKILLSGSADGTVKLWELGPITFAKILDTSKVTLADILDGGNIDEDDHIRDQRGPMIAALGPTSTDTIVSSLTAHETDLVRFVVNPALPLMATSSSYNCVRIWAIEDLSQPRLIHEFTGHEKVVTQVRLCHGGNHVLSCSHDYFLSLYHAESFRRLGKMDCKGSALSFALSPDEKIAFVGGNDYPIKGFSLVPDTPRTFGQILECVGHCGQVVSLAISNDGHVLASTALDFSLKLWRLKSEYVGEVETLEACASIEPHNGHAMSIAFSTHATGLLASGGADHTVAVWQVDTNRGNISPLWRSPTARDGPGHASVVTAVTWGSGPSADLLFSGSWDHTIKVWVYNSRSMDSVPAKTIFGHTHRISSLKVSPDGTRLVSASADQTLRLWDVTSVAGEFSCLVQFQNQTHEGIPMAVDMTNKVIIAGEENGMLRLWSVDTAAHGLVQRAEDSIVSSSTVAAGIFDGAAAAGVVPPGVLDTGAGVSSTHVGISFSESERSLI